MTSPMTAAFASLAFALLAAPALAAEPFAGGDPKAGKALHAKSCVSCHSAEAYSPARRKIRSAEALAARVASCNLNTGAGWFPEEELHVGSFLNAQHYKFKAPAAQAPKKSAKPN